MKINSIQKIHIKLEPYLVILHHCGCYLLIVVAKQGHHQNYPTFTSKASHNRLQSSIHKTPHFYSQNLRFWLSLILLIACKCQVLFFLLFFFSTSLHSHYIFFLKKGEKAKLFFFSLLVIIVSISGGCFSTF